MVFIMTFAFRPAGARFFPYVGLVDGGVGQIKSLNPPETQHSCIADKLQEQPGRDQPRPGGGQPGLRILSRAASSLCRWRSWVWTRASPTRPTTCSPMPAASGAASATSWNWIRSPSPPTSSSSAAKSAPSTILIIICRKGDSWLVVAGNWWPSSFP